MLKVNNLKIPKEGPINLLIKIKSDPCACTQTVIELILAPTRGKT